MHGGFGHAEPLRHLPVAAEGEDELAGMGQHVLLRNAENADWQYAENSPSQFIRKSRKVPRIG
jgi:hypothetical protein